MNNKKVVDVSVVLWLAIGCLLVLVMIVVGGITRLTHSGLSIVQWNLFMGSIPPLSTSAWEHVFQLYQQTPEFRLKNYNFTLSEFKSIFWWEYIHRMIGRLIGIVFIMPFIYFWIKKRFYKSLIQKLFIVFALGACQGFMGWYMVKSGLVKNPNVSHYRLAVHLILAFTLYGITFWLMLDRLFFNLKPTVKPSPLVKVSVLTLVVLTIQIIYGAFVSGLKAGRIYNTFPKMGDSWVSASVGYAFHKDGWVSLFENLATVQFIHRYIAYLVIVLVFYIWIKSRQLVLNSFQKQAKNMLLFLLFFQVVLGVFTLVMAVPIVLGVLHQLGALLLFTAMIYWIFRLQVSESEPCTQ